MHNVEVTIKMFQTKIDVIDFASTSRDNICICLARERQVCVPSPAICGHRSGDSQERLHKMAEIEAYNDCMGTRSTATALQLGNSLATSIILWGAISTRQCYQEMLVYQLPLPQPRSRMALTSKPSSAMICGKGGGYFPITLQNISCCLSLTWMRERMGRRDS